MGMLAGVESERLAEAGIISLFEKRVKLGAFKHSSESEAVEKALWLVKYFEEHGRFHDGPELNLSGGFPKNILPV
jgi:hypothetical protein